MCVCVSLETKQTGTPKLKIQIYSSQSVVLFIFIALLFSSLLPSRLLIETQQEEICNVYQVVYKCGDCNHEESIMDETQPIAMDNDNDKNTDAVPLKDPGDSVPWKSDDFSHCWLSVDLLLVVDLDTNVAVWTLHFSGGIRNDFWKQQQQQQQAAANTYTSDPWKEFYYWLPIVFPTTWSNNT